MISMILMPFISELHFDTPILCYHSRDSSFFENNSEITVMVSFSIFTKNKTNKTSLDLCWEDEKTCCVESSVSDVQKVLCKWYLPFPAKQKGSGYSTSGTLQSGHLQGELFT